MYLVYTTPLFYRKLLRFSLLCFFFALDQIELLYQLQFQDKSGSIREKGEVLISREIMQKTTIRVAL